MLRHQSDSSVIAECLRVVFEIAFGSRDASLRNQVCSDSEVPQAGFYCLLKEEFQMLVLSRKADESVVIAEGEITIKVLSIRGDVVRLGIVAPKEIPIHREEVHNAIERERLLMQQ